MSFFKSKFLEGFEKKVVLDRDTMKPRVEFVYEGYYYTSELPEKERLARKIAHTVIFLACTAVHIYAMTLKCDLNRIWYLSAAEIIMIFDYLGLAVSTFEKAVSKRKMAVWEYRMSSVSLKEFSLIGVGVYLLLAVMWLIRLISARPAVPLRELAALGLYAACCAALWANYRIEKTARYSEKKSDDVLHGIDITNDL